MGDNMRIYHIGQLQYYFHHFCPGVDKLYHWAMDGKDIHDHKGQLSS